MLYTTMIVHEEECGIHSKVLKEFYDIMSKDIKRNHIIKSLMIMYSAQATIPICLQQVSEADHMHTMDRFAKITF